MDDGVGPDGESRHDRDSRRLRELLEETRVAMPGVQVLFAFLLAVPFQQRFEQLSDLERDVYVVALLAAALATALFIAPSAFHRLRFRRRDFILDGSTPAVVSASTTGVFVLLWFVLGLARGRAAAD